MKAPKKVKAPMLLEAVEQNKLDKRVNWFAFCGTVTRSETLTTTCFACEGFGCAECGYTRKRRTSYPVPALDKDHNPIETSSPDWTYLRPKDNPNL